MAFDGPKGEGNTAPALTRKEFKEFRRLLLDKRRDLLGDLSGMTAEARGSGPGKGDRADGPPEQTNCADESDDREITIGLLHSERVLLREIHDALGRIEKGTYGICLGTGEPIGKSRLLARPWAKYCIAYARAMEQKRSRAAAYPRNAFSIGHFRADDDTGHARESQDVRSIVGEDDI